MDLTTGGYQDNIIFFPGVKEQTQHGVQFNEVALEWLFENVKDDITSRTLGQYYGIVDGHLLPIGEGKKINRETFIMFVSKLKVLAQEKPRTAKLAIDILRRILEYAIENNYALDNLPLSTLKKIKISSKAEDEAKYIGEDLREKIIALSAYHHILHPIMVTLLFLGIRSAELRALRWPDIDFKTGRIKIHNSTTYELEIDPYEGILSKQDVVASTKTEAGCRIVYAPKIVLKALARWKAHCIIKKLYSHQGIVFVTTSGTMRTYSGLLSLFRRFCKKHTEELYGMNITPHMLRHTCATMLLEQKVNPRIVQIILGHAHVTTTLQIYSHVSESILMMVAKQFDDMFESIMQKKYMPVI